jgi:hypothetical protein
MACERSGVRSPSAPPIHRRTALKAQSDLLLLIDLGGYHPFFCNDRPEMQSCVPQHLNMDDACPRGKLTRVVAGTSGLGEGMKR